MRRPVARAGSHTQSALLPATLVTRTGPEVRLSSSTAGQLIEKIDPGQSLVIGVDSIAETLVEGGAFAVVRLDNADEPRRRRDAAKRFATALLKLEEPGIERGFYEVDLKGMEPGTDVDAFRGIVDRERSSPSFPRRGDLTRAPPAPAKQCVGSGPMCPIAWRRGLGSAVRP